MHSQCSNGAQDATSNWSISNCLARAVLAAPRIIPKAMAQAVFAQAVLAAPQIIPKVVAQAVLALK